MKTDWIEWIGLIAAVLTTSAFIPQVYKTWKTRNVQGLSLVMYVIFLAGLLLWLFYGLAIGSPGIIFANAVTSLLVVYLLSMIVRNR